MRKSWVWALVLVVVAMVALPVMAADGTDLAAVVARLTGLEKRVEALEAGGFARINKVGALGTATVEGVTVTIQGVTAGPHGTIVAARIANGSDKPLGFMKFRFALVAGGQQLTDPLYRIDFTDDVIQPQASRDFVMVFDPLPAGTSTVRFIPALTWKGEFMPLDVSVEGSVK